jgi:hypothetical protein
LPDSILIIGDKLPADDEDEPADTPLPLILEDGKAGYGND